MPLSDIVDPYRSFFSRITPNDFPSVECKKKSDFETFENRLPGSYKAYTISPLIHILSIEKRNIIQSSSSKAFHNCTND